MRLEKFSNDINFKARLSVTLPEKRWKNITKAFRKSTDGIDYRLELYNEADILLLSAQSRDLKSKLNKSIIIFSKQGAEKLGNLSDTEIIQKMQKFLKICQETDELKQQACEIWDKISKNDKQGYLQIYEGDPELKITQGKELVRRLENAICGFKLGQLQSDDLFKHTCIFEN